MTTPKPASAPPADALADRLNSIKLVLLSAMPHRCALFDYEATMDEAIAASAQVREGEALPDAAKYLATLQPIPGVASRDWQRGWDACCAYVKRKPAPEPIVVPVEPPLVAQGDDWAWADLPWRATSSWLRSASGSKIAEVGDFANLSEREARLIADAVNNFADHARREAELESQLVSARTRIGQLEAACDGRFADYDRELKRANSLEASLAACRSPLITDEMVDRWQALGNELRKTRFYTDVNSYEYNRERLRRWLTSVRK